MEVVLIRSNPVQLKNSRLPRSLNKELGCIPPLGLAYIAAYLRENGVEVAIIDAEAEKLSLDGLRARLGELAPWMVGITSMTPTVHDDLAIARLAKEMGSVVVFGGPQVAAMPRETAACPEVDYAILGEGELPLLELVRALRAQAPVRDVPGLIYTDELGQVQANPPFIFDTIDGLPLPARELLPYDKYESVISAGRLTTLCPGRGCPFKCGFCFKQPADSKVRFRSPGRVVDEVEEVIKRYRVREINFVSDTLTLKKDFISEMCENILRRNIKVSWIAPTRADCVTKDLLKIMKLAGCRSLRFGVESGSNEIRGLMGKSLDKAQILNAFQWAREADIESFAYLIVGYIHETADTVRETLDFVKKLKPNLLMYNIATPLPGTPLFKQSVEAGLVDADYWQRYLRDPDCERIPYLFPEAEKWIGVAYRDFFFSPRFLLKKLMNMRPSDIPHYIRAVRGLLGLGR